MEARRGFGTPGRMYGESPLPRPRRGSHTSVSFFKSWTEKKAWPKSETGIDSRTFRRARLTGRQHLGTGVRRDCLPAPPQARGVLRAGPRCALQAPNAQAPAHAARFRFLDFTASTMQGEM